MAYRLRLGVGKERLVNVVALLGIDGEVVDFATMVMRVVTQVGSEVLATLAPNHGVNIGEVTLAKDTHVIVDNPTTVNVSSVTLASGARVTLDAGSNRIGEVTLPLATTVGLAAGTQAIGKLATNTGVNIGEVSLKIGSTVALVNDGAAPYVRTIVGANVARTQMPNQAVKGKIRLQAGASLVGSVTVSDALDKGVPLANKEYIEIPCTNLNQLWYQFSSIGGQTPHLYVIAGI